MKLAYTTACIFPTEKPIWMLRQSADKFGVNLQPYGMEDTPTFKGWLSIKVYEFRKAATTFLGAGYTHCFYTDGRDSFLISGAMEIESKYRKLGIPPYLIATEPRCYPFPEYSDNFPETGHCWRWLGAGQFICDLKWALAMWEKLEAKYAGMTHENHDQGWLEMGYVDGLLDPKEFVLDTSCTIFQSAGAEDFESGRLEVRNCRVHNTVTHSHPCAIHFPGGYSDPETGKDELIRPYFEAIHG